MNKPKLRLRKNSIKFMTFGVKSKIKEVKKKKNRKRTGGGELVTPSLTPSPLARTATRPHLENN